MEQEVIAIAELAAAAITALIAAVYFVKSLQKPKQ